MESRTKFLEQAKARALATIAEAGPQPKENLQQACISLLNDLNMHPEFDSMAIRDAYSMAASSAQLQTPEMVRQFINSIK